MTDNVLQQPYALSGVRVHPAFVEQFGSSLYKTDKLGVSFRETVQNSVDACITLGVLPDITVVLKKLGGREYRITTTDNGCGMNPEQIVNEFLCLGGTNKRQGKNDMVTGGFGVATMIFFTSKDWSAKTNAWTSSKQLMMANPERPYEDSEPISGTVVDLLMETKSWSSEDSVIYIAYTSDIDIHLNITDESGNTILDDIHAGLPQGIHQMKDSDNEMFTVRILDPIKTPKMDITGINAIRINGLTQFYTRSWKRETNLIFDIKTDKRPGDPEYPTTLSREELKEPYASFFDQRVDFHNENSLHSKFSLAQAYVPPTATDMKFHTQNLTNGTRISDPEEQKMIAELIAMTDDKPLARKDIRARFPAAHEYQIDAAMEMLTITDENVAFYLDSYYVKDVRMSKSRKQLRAVWFKLIRLCTSISDHFGIGFTGSYSETTRQYVDGTWYYLIDPKVIEQMVANKSSMAEIVGYLHFCAAHEAAHYYEDSHNERHSRKHADIFKETLPAFEKMKPYLVRQLKKVYQTVR